MRKNFEHNLLRTRRLNDRVRPDSVGKQVGWRVGNSACLPQAPLRQKTTVIGESRSRSYLSQLINVVVPLNEGVLSALNACLYDAFLRFSSGREVAPHGGTSTTGSK